VRRAFKRPPRRRAAVLASGRRRLRASLAGRELGFITTSTQTSLLLTTGLARGGKGGEGGGATLHVPAPRPPAALLANSLKPPRSAANPKISNYNPAPQRLANSRPPRQIPRFQITIPAPSVFMQTRQIPRFQIAIPAPSAFMQTRQIPKFQIAIPAPSAFQTRQIPKFQITIPAPRALQTRQIPKFQITIPAPSALQTRQIPRFQITIPAPSAFMQTRDLLGKSPDFNLQIPVLRPPGQHA
jgi:hypothetical protein